MRTADTPSIPHALSPTPYPRPQRYREILHDFKAAYRRQLAAVTQRRENAALLAGGGRSGGGSGGGGGTAANSEASAVDALLRERSALTSSSKALDAVLAQAAETRDALARQRAGIASAAGRVGSIMSTLPGVTQLMGAISARRLRNERSMALVMAACACFLIWAFVLRG